MALQKIFKLIIHNKSNILIKSFFLKLYYMIWDYQKQSCEELQYTYSQNIQTKNFFHLNQLFNLLLIIYDSK